jgi:hypothetical protein
MAKPHDTNEKQRDDAPKSNAPEENPSGERSGVSGHPRLPRAPRERSRPTDRDQMGGEGE